MKSYLRQVNILRQVTSNRLSSIAFHRPAYCGQSTKTIGPNGLCRFHGNKRLGCPLVFVPVVLIFSADLIQIDRNTRFPLGTAIRFGQSRIIRHQRRIGKRPHHRNNLLNRKLSGLFNQFSCGSQLKIRKLNRVTFVRIKLTGKPFINDNLIAFQTRQKPITANRTHR